MHHHHVPKPNGDLCAWPGRPLGPPAGHPGPWAGHGPRPEDGF